MSQTGGGSVPPVLLSIDAKAEEIVAATRVNDWPRVYAYIQDINEAWVDYQNPTIEPEREPLAPAAAALAGQLGAKLAALKDAAAERNAPQTVRTANDVSAAAADLYEYYHPVIPADLRKLEILERRLLIDLWYNAFDSASDTLETAEATWQQVRPEIRAYAGDTGIQAIQDQLNTQRTALAAKNQGLLTSSVETTIKLIDGVQSLY